MEHNLSLSKLRNLRRVDPKAKFSEGYIEERQLFVLAGIGRSGLCLLHALLAASSRFQASQSMLTHGDSCREFLLHPTRAVQEHCIEMLSSSNNLFHHFPSESYGENFWDHSQCTCRPSQDKAPLIHMHSLLTNPIMFGEFLSGSKEMRVKPKLIVSVADWDRTVKSRFFKAGRRDRISGYFGVLSAMLVDSYLSARAYDRLDKLQAAGLEMQLVNVADLNQNATGVAQRVSSFVESELEFSIPILVRGMEWTGGRTPPFGREHANKSYPSLRGIQAKLLTKVDPTQGGLKFFKASTVYLTLISIIACLRAPYFVLYTGLRVITARSSLPMANFESVFPEITVASQIFREIQVLARNLGKL